MIKYINSRNMKPFHLGICVPWRNSVKMWCKELQYCLHKKYKIINIYTEKKPKALKVTEIYLYINKLELKKTQ